MGYVRLLWREAVHHWRARFKSEGIRLMKYLVGFAMIFALFLATPALATWGLKWQIAAAPVAASIGMLVLSFLYDLIMAPYRVHQRMSGCLEKSNNLLARVIEHEPILERLSQLYSNGRRKYNEIVIVSEYETRFNDWNGQVLAILRAHFTTSERHEFNNSYSGGATYTIREAPEERLEATEITRMTWTARLHSLDHIIRVGGGSFIGPKDEIQTMLASKEVLGSSL
jgi:hypothetical protein